MDAQPLEAAERRTFLSRLVTRSEPRSQGGSPLLDPLSDQYHVAAASASKVSNRQSFGADSVSVGHRWRISSLNTRRSEPTQQVLESDLGGSPAVAKRLGRPRSGRCGLSRRCDAGHQVALIATGFLNNILVEAGGRRPDGCPSGPILVKGCACKEMAPVDSGDADVEVEGEFLHRRVTWQYVGNDVNVRLRVGCIIL